ncbi:hypothetical protein BJF78_13880 [Pseudonocardia sp. CNS-139]|nr:hypothetical protein BJF78_13880 [Pseudonocardia sp. CNS-139]
MTATAPLTATGGTTGDIGLGYHTVAISPTRLAAVASEVEELGLDSLWMAETKHDPFVGLAVAAARTGRVRVNTGLAVAFARNPMTVAVAANDLQLLSGGRFGLGLGSQMKTHITRRFGMPWSSPAAGCGSSCWPCGRSGTRSGRGSGCGSAASSTGTR